MKDRQNEYTKFIFSKENTTPILLVPWWFTAPMFWCYLNDAKHDFKKAINTTIDRIRQSDITAWFLLLKS